MMPAARARGATFRRILVGLDSSAPSLAALDAAVRLAVELEAELEGLFIEDVNLLHFAGLPFTRVIDAASSQARAIDRPDLERELRARAESVRRKLASAAGERVSWTFRVVRGQVEAEFMAAAREADLVSIGFVGDRRGGAAGTGSLARRAVLESPGSVLLLRCQQGAGSPVAVCLDDGRHGDRALDCAASLAKSQGGGLTVVTFAGDENEERDIEARATDRLGDVGLKPRFLHLGAAGAHDLDAASRAAQGGVLVVSAESPLVGGELLRTLVENCACSLLLAR